MRRTALAVMTLFAVVASGVLLAGANLGVTVGAAAGIMVVGGVATLGTSTDRLVWITVSILVLTITWNGIRLGGGALGDVFMAMAFAAVVAHLLLEKRGPYLPPWLLLSGTGYVLAGILSTIFPPSVDLANRAVVQQESLLTVPGYLPPRSDGGFLLKFELSAMLIPLLVIVAAKNRSRCAQLVNLWTLGVFVNAAVAVADYAGVAHLSPNPIVASRSSGLTIHPNYLALSAVMAIPSAMIWIGRSRRWTMAGTITVAMLLGGVYASGSRAGAVAAVSAVVVTALAVPRFRRTILPLLPFAGMVLVVALVFTKVGSHIVHQVRLGGGDPSAAGSNAQRSADAHLAFIQIRARPLEGVGFSVIQDAHDIYLQLLAAGGVIALGSFLVFCGGLAGAARRAWSGLQRDEVVAAVVAILVWLINGIFDNQLADKYLYVVPGLLLAMSRVAALRAERAPSVQAPAPSFPPLPTDAPAAGTPRAPARPLSSTR
jgi:hypothetical protein